MKIKILSLSASEQAALSLGFLTGESHCFRMRCRVVLLKSEGLSSVRVGEQTEMTAQSVDGWVKRFEAEGNLKLLVYIAIVKLFRLDKIK